METAVIPPPNLTYNSTPNKTDPQFTETAIKTMSPVKVPLAIKAAPPGLCGVPTRRPAAAGAHSSRSEGSVLDGGDSEVALLHALGGQPKVPSVTEILHDARYTILA